ncbi:MAG: hypothetical protein ACI87A_000757, partial [Planctomycetota bacterium]
FEPEWPGKSPKWLELFRFIPEKLHPLSCQIDQLRAAVARSNCAQQLLETDA